MSELSDSDKFQPLRQEEDARYILHDPREIGRVLQLLAKKKALVSAHLAPLNRVLPTMLVDVSIDTGWLSLDGSRDPAINKQVEQSHHVTCVSMLDQVPIQFQLDRVERQKTARVATLIAPLPLRVLYLQRREYHRCKASLAQPVVCSVPGRQMAGELETPRMTIEVLDLSIGGMCLQLRTGGPPLPDSTDVECQLHLPDAEPLELLFRVRSRFQARGGPGMRHTRVGCQFAALPSGAENAIQRYIFSQDRLRKARERGDA